MRQISKKQMRTLRKAQQGEVDAVFMYKRLARKAKRLDEMEAFIRLAKDEARHADVFKVYTQKELRPFPAKGILVPLMYRFLGREKTFPIIAKAEYDAAKKYEDVVPDFPEVEEVMNDEVHHGDAVMGLLK